MSFRFAIGTVDIGPPPLFRLPTPPNPRRVTTTTVPLSPALSAGRSAQSQSRITVTDQLTRSIVPMDIEPPFDATALGLKEIGNLASWTVSSSKPGCGVAALRDDDTNLFWQ